jgi:hypothetical protein
MESEEVVARERSVRHSEGQVDGTESRRRQRLTKRGRLRERQGQRRDTEIEAGLAVAVAVACPAAAGVGGASSGVGKVTAGQGRCCDVATGGRGGGGSEVVDSTAGRAAMVAATPAHAHAGAFAAGAAGGFEVDGGKSCCVLS